MAEEIIEKTSHYLTFTLDNDHYAIDVAKVLEVLEYIKITRVPRMPEFMCGVINLRGSVIPVIDLRLKFGLDKGEETVDTSIIIMEIALKEEVLTVGAITDSVQEVVEILPSSIEPAPKIGTKLDTGFIYGIGKIDEDFIIILNIDKIMTIEDLSALNIREDAVQKSIEEAGVDQ